MTTKDKTVKHSSIAVWTSRLVLVLLVVAIGYGGWIVWEKVSNADTSPLIAAITGKVIPSSTPSEIANKEPDQEKAVEIAEELAERISQHEKLPAQSVFGVMGLTALANDQQSNKASMAGMLDSVTREIGATRAAGAIRTLRENREAMVEIEQMAKSSDPATVATAKTMLAKLKDQNTQLEALVQESLAKEGIELTEAQIRALCASPNAEDTASMISAFGSLKMITGKMEERLRMKPSQDQAQRYYGAHCVMLMALDKIQKRAMKNIELTHIPKALQIRRDSEATMANAQELLAGPKTEDLSKNERQALSWNIGSCKKTVEMTHRTEEKLRRNLEIIQRANQKLMSSIATAQNCHRTALLQKEVIALETSHSQEIARIEALTIPELAAINFADPENIEVSEPTLTRPRL
jgi:hypothetical protein